MGKGVFTFFAAHQPGQTGAVGGALLGQFFAQRDGLAVLVERHEHGHVFFGAAYAQLHAIDQAVQHMGEVQFAAHELVAHAGPAGFLAGDDLHAVLLVQTQHAGHDYAGAVGERNEADLHLLFLGGIGALGMHERAQRRAGAQRAHGGCLQHGAALKAGFQQFGHGSASFGWVLKRQKQKGVLMPFTPASGSAQTHGDAFVR
jgi:hypothetical protein